MHGPARSSLGANPVLFCSLILLFPLFYNLIELRMFIPYLDKIYCLEACVISKQFCRTNALKPYESTRNILHIVLQLHENYEKEFTTITL
jgi:hypothetical protein